MKQYSSENKAEVDLIAPSDSPLDTKDILLYILNGLPLLYQAFKKDIWTSLHPMSLDNLYSLLCSEETIQINEAACNVLSDSTIQYGYLQTTGEEEVVSLLLQIF